MNPIIDQLGERLFWVSLALLIFALVSVAFLNYFTELGDVVSMVQTAPWPSTEGRISDIDRTSATFGRPRSGGIRVTGYHLTINYDYTVSGLHFEGKQDRFLDHGWLGIKDTSSPFHCTYYCSAADTEQIESSFAKGTTVRVYYNPSNPVVSYIDRNVSGAIILNLFGVMGFLVCFLLFVHFAFLVAKSNPSSNEGTEFSGEPKPRSVKE